MFEDLVPIAVHYLFLFSVFLHGVLRRAMRSLYAWLGFPRCAGTFARDLPSAFFLWQRGMCGLGLLSVLFSSDVRFSFVVGFFCHFVVVFCFVYLHLHLDFLFN